VAIDRAPALVSRGRDARIFRDDRPKQPIALLKLVSTQTLMLDFFYAIQHAQASLLMLEEYQTLFAA